MRKISIAVGVALVLGLLFVAALAPTAPLNAQSSAGCYRASGGDTWICQSGGFFEFQSGSALEVQSGATLTASTATITGTLVVGGNSDFTGNVEVVDHLLTQAELYMIPPDAVTVTNGGTITPTGAVVELTAAGAVGAAMAAAGDGQFLILINTVNQTITISETASARMAGDFAMGQYDTLTLIGQGVTWHEVARSNN